MEYIGFLGAILAFLGTAVLVLWERPSLRVRAVCLCVGLIGVTVAGIVGIFLSKQATALLTGGDDFCYVIPEGTPRPPFPAIVLHEGEYPLYDVNMRVVDLSKFKILPNGAIAGQTSLFLGDFPVGPTALGPLSYSFPAKGEKASFNIFFSAKNGFWVENLRTRFVNGKWVSAYRVFRYRLTGGKLRPYTLFEKHDRGYPISKNGEPDWSDH